MEIKKNKIGILGGSFDPAHKGHLAISKDAKKRLRLKKIIWAITKKNPFKKESATSVLTRIKQCKKIRQEFLDEKHHLDYLLTFIDHQDRVSS